MNFLVKNGIEVWVSWLYEVGDCLVYDFLDCWWVELIYNGVYGFIDGLVKILSFKNCCLNDV